MLGASVLLSIHEYKLVNSVNAENHVETRSLNIQQLYIVCHIFLIVFYCILGQYLKKISLFIQRQSCFSTINLPITYMYMSYVVFGSTCFHPWVLINLKGHPNKL